MNDVHSLIAANLFHFSSAYDIFIEDMMSLLAAIYNDKQGNLLVTFFSAKTTLALSKNRKENEKLMQLGCILRELQLKL